jgi:hypothetical protein
MRISRRARGSRSYGTAIVELGLFGLALLPAMGAGGCGRIGYDPLPESALPADAAPPVRDASVHADTGDNGDAIANVDADEAAADSGDDVVSNIEEDAADAADSQADAKCTQSAAVDYCQTIPPLPAPPIIDGVLDCGPTLVPIVPEDWRGAAPLPPFPAGNSAEVAAAWRPDGLYIFISVTTPAVIPADPTSQDYFGAGVELFVDATGSFATPSQYNDPGTVQVIVTAPCSLAADASTDACFDASTDAASEASDGAMDDAIDEASTEAAADGQAAESPNGQRAEVYRSEAALGPWTSSQFGTFLSPGGFVFEGFVVASDLGLSTWQLAPGGHVGFDVAVDVSFPTECMIGLEGHRAGQYFLNVPASDTADAADAGDGGPIGPPYEDTRSFCTPTLTSM